MRRTNEKILFGLMMSILVLVVFSGVWVSECNASGGSVEIEVSVRGTYLHADPGQQGPTADIPVDYPGVADLKSNGFSVGDTILVSFEGSYDNNGGWNPEQTPVYEPLNSLIGVFSSTNQLLSISDADRVPGAIDAGDDVITTQTYFTHENTDIPEDFQITPSSGYSIEVPQNAKYLFISIHDSYYPDNVATSPIKVTIEKQASESLSGGFPLEYILAGLGVVAIIAVLLVFVMLKRRKPRTRSTPQIQAEAPKA